MSARPQVVKVDLLKFHQFGRTKYSSLGKEYTLKQMKVQDDKQFSNVKELYLRAGIKIV